MPTNFVVTSKDNPRQQYDEVSKNDSVKYTIDFTPWQDDNDTVTSITWTLESGQASIGTPSTTAAVSSCVISFPQAGRSMISVLATTATLTKKYWMNIMAYDEKLSIYMDGYYTNGIGT